MVDGVPKRSREKLTACLHWGGPDETSWSGWEPHTSLFGSTHRMGALGDAPALWKRLQFPSPDRWEQTSRRKALCEELTVRKSKDESVIPSAPWESCVPRGQDKPLTRTALSLITLPVLSTIALSLETLEQKHGMKSRSWCIQNASQDAENKPGR